MNWEPILRDNIKPNINIIPSHASNPISIEISCEF